MKSWNEVKEEMAQIRRNHFFDQEAHQARVELVGQDLGFEATKHALRELQAFGKIPTA